MVNAWSVKVTYHCFQYQNAYWICLTISEFGNRKKPKDTKGICYFLGGSIALVASVTGIYTAYYFWQLLYH
jgi:hypothetical protein